MALLNTTISKLNGKNYSSWATDIKFLLIERGLWKVVNQDEKPPTDLVEAKTFNDKCDRALSTIYLNIEEEYKRLIKSETSPVKAWETLKVYFEPDDRVQHQLIFNELLECKPNRNEGYAIYFSKVKELLGRLDAIKHPMDADRAIFHVLRFLPDSFASLVQHIMSWPATDFNLNKVEAAILAEDARQKLRQQDKNAASVAMNTETRGRRIQKTFSCFRCGIDGHYARNCKVKSPNNNLSRSSGISPYSTNRRKSPWKHPTRNRPSSRGRFKSRKNSPSVGDESKPRSFFIQACLSERDSDAFVIDTAASHHFCKNKSYFSIFEPICNEKVSVAVSNTTFSVEGRGQIHLMFDNEEIILKNVLYSPHLRRNLIAGNLMDKAGLSFIGRDGMIKVKTSCKVLFTAILKDGIYYTYPKVKIVPRAKPVEDITLPARQGKRVKFETSAVEKGDPVLWHKRFAHISSAILHKTSVNDSVRGLPEMPSNPTECEPCRLAKSKRKSFKSIGQIRSRRPLELIYMDICGPIEPEGRDGQRYFLSIVDDFSRKVSIFPIFYKSDAFSTFKRFQTRAERYLNSKILSVRTDNGGEFCNYEFEEYFKDLGIKFEKTNPYTPEQNGVVERLNYTIMDGVKAQLEESGMDKSFWPEGVLNFAYVWNRVCHSNQDRTPIELFGGNKPSVRHLKPFGVTAYVGIPKQKRVKLDNRARKGYMVGYALRTRGYRIWLPDEDKVIETINVSFNEKSFFKGISDQASSSSFPDNGSGAVMGHSNQYLLNLNNDSLDDDSSSSRVIDEITETPSLLASDQVSEQTPISLSSQIFWKREAIRRPDGSRTDIYYYPADTRRRLRSMNEIKKYCEEKNILFSPHIFDFNGRNLYVGPVSDGGTGVDVGSVSLTDAESS